MIREASWEFLQGTEEMNEDIKYYKEIPRLKW